MLFRRAGHRWVVAIWFCAAKLCKNPKSIIRYAVFIAFVLFAFSLLWESSKRELTIGGLLDTMTYGYLSRKGRQVVREQLRLVALELAELQHGLDVSPHDIHKLGKQIEVVNGIIRSVQEDTGDKNSGKPPVLKKQEVCPEVFSEKGFGYAGHVKCKEFVPMHQLITLLMYAPNKFPKLSMSYLEMMQGVAKYYPESRVILATSQAVQEADAISKLNIKFKNEIITDSNEGSMWSSLLAQVETPYLLIAPRITHFDDDVDLYRLVRVLSYRDDVTVAGGSYRNVTAQWDLGCRQASLDYWTAKYSFGYYRSFNECAVCDYLPGPFAAKTKVLKELDFDGSLSRGAFHDLFWRLQRRGMRDNTAVVCPDVMFNIDTPRTTDVDYAAFANKHEIKKLVEPDGRVRWYGCRRGLSYTKGRECSWSDGMGVPPCDLWNLGEVVKFVMLACEEAEVSCEYAAGTVLGAVKFASVIPWEKDADIHFYASNFTQFAKLKPKFLAAGFEFEADISDLRCCLRGRYVGGGFTIRTTNWHVSMYGRHTLEAGDMRESRKLPTKVPMAGAWVTTPRNPGLFSRNHYVYNYLRHSEHHGGDSFYDAGAFQKCAVRGHSACLNRYPADGNVQFLDYVP